MLRFAVLATFVALAAGAVLPKEGPSPRIEVVEVFGRNYTFGMDSVNWYSAEAVCNALGQRLLVLETAAAGANWVSWMQQNSRYDTWTWIGGRREEGGSEFIWVPTGMPFDPTESWWGNSQPNNSNRYAQCVNFMGSATSGGWEDDRCDTLDINYICEEIPM